MAIPVFERLFIPLFICCLALFEKNLIDKNADHNDDHNELFLMTFLLVLKTNKTLQPVSLPDIFTTTNI